MKAQNITYADLSQRLAAIGLTESAPSIKSKLSRGTFSVAFLLQIAVAPGSDIACKPLPL